MKPVSTLFIPNTTRSLSLRNTERCEQRIRWAGGSSYVKRETENPLTSPSELIVPIEFGPMTDNLEKYVDKIPIVTHSSQSRVPYFASATLSVCPLVCRTPGRQRNPR